MTNNPEYLEIIKHFEDIDVLPKGEILLNKAEKIENATNFVKSHISVNEVP